MARAGFREAALEDQLHVCARDWAEWAELGLRAGAEGATIRHGTGIGQAPLACLQSATRNTLRALAVGSPGASITPR